MMREMRSGKEVYWIDRITSPSSPPPSPQTFNALRGVAYCKSLDLLLLCDFNNKRIIIIKGMSGEYHSHIPLPFKPYDIALSLSSNRMIISDASNNQVHIYSITMSMISGGESIEKAFIALPHPSIELGDKSSKPSYPLHFHYPWGVAIHSSANYFAVVDSYNSRVKFYKLDDFSFISSLNTSFSRPCAIHICKSLQFIVVSDVGNQNIIEITGG